MPSPPEMIDSSNQPLPSRKPDRQGRDRHDHVVTDSPRQRSRSSSPRRSRRRGSRSRSPYDRARDSGTQRGDRYHSRRKSRSRSPESSSLAAFQRSRRALPSQEDSYRKENAPEGSAVAEAQPKQTPNFKPTGLLAADSNKIEIGSGSKSRSIALKYHEPPEARKPPASEQWMLYVFKGGSDEPILTVPLHSRSCWLFGRETAVVDIPTEHPSCSKQHAVLQFRYTMKKDEWGEKKGKVGLYLLDLESSNGTKLNGEMVDAARYIQCMPNDVVKFGDSEREYVLLLPPKS